MVSSYLLSLKHLSPKTLAFKEYALSLWEEYGGGMDFGKESLSSFVAFLSRKDLSSSSIRAILGEVLSYGRWLRDRGYGVKMEDVRALLRTIRVYRRAEPFSEEELNMVFSTLKERFHPIYYVFSLLLLHSGIRLSEALSLRAEDLIVKRLKLEREGKVEERELLFLSVKEGKFSKPYRAGMPLLSEEEKATLKSFFASRRGKPLWLYVLEYPKSVKEKVLTEDAVHKTFQRLSKATGIRVYPHRFRYTYASRLLAMGFSLALVQSWLGHSSPSTTLLSYARAMEEIELMRLWK